MRKANMAVLLVVPVLLGLVFGAHPTAAQVQVGGDYMVRAYAERFSNSMDDRGDENYMRFLGRIYMHAPVADNASLRTDFVTLSENPEFPTRSIAGTGAMRYGISQIYGEVMTPDFLVFDLARFRIGRQQYGIGEGLSLGESYYLADKFDGLRCDFSYRNWTFGLFGAITAQSLSESGLYPEPGSDQLYVGKVEYQLYRQTLLAYSIYEKNRGDFNDNVITGFGSSGSVMHRDLNYFVEVARQDYNTLAGLPEKSGMGYMAGLSYRWSMGPFRQIKAEIRGAGYQGDDAATDRIETFSPFYPSWWWGDRTGYVNGSIGGDYPHRGIQLEGSRVWYGRVYFSPTAVPKARLQFQYVTVGDWVDNDDYTEPDDEFAVKLYYQVNDNVRVQGRYVKRIPNGEDEDLNDSGTITSIEDKVDAERFMVEFRVQF